MRVFHRRAAADFTVTHVPHGNPELLRSSACGHHHNPVFVPQHSASTPEKQACKPRVRTIEKIQHKNGLATNDVDHSIANHAPMDADTTSVTSCDPSELSDASVDSLTSVDVDFEFYNMAESDFHSIRTFCSQLFGTRAPVSFSGMAKMATEELADHVGTTVKSEGEESDPLGFATIIPSSMCPADLKAYIRNSAVQSNFEACEKVDKILSRKTTAILLHDRFMNLPVDIASPLYSQLLDDLEHAENEDKRFNVEQLFVLARTYREVKSNMDEPSKKHFHAATSDLQFFCPEFEFIAKYATMSWNFEAADEASSDSRRAFGDCGVKPSRQCFLVSLESFRKFVGEIQGFMV